MLYRSSPKSVELPVVILPKVGRMFFYDPESDSYYDPRERRYFDGAETAALMQRRDQKISVRFGVEFK